MLIQPCLKSETEYWSVSSILHSIKSYSSQPVPKVMKHIGTVWQSERYDRIVRNDQEFEYYWEYITQNPVKAGLSAIAEEYPFLWKVSDPD